MNPAERMATLGTASMLYKVKIVSCDFLTLHV